MWRRRWWIAGVSAAIVCCAAILVLTRPAFGAWTQTAVTWAKDRATHPLARVGPLRGAAFAALSLPGFTPSTIWASQPAHAAELRRLQRSLADAHPVPSAHDTNCAPMEPPVLDLLPETGPTVEVVPVWTCLPHSNHLSISRSLVLVSDGNQNVVVHAPAVAGAMTAHWPAPQPRLVVSPARCLPGCSVTVQGHDILTRAVTLTARGDGPPVRLAVLQVHSGSFVWTGTLPAGVHPGTVEVSDGPLSQVPLTVLPPGTPASLPATGPAATVVPGGRDTLIYPAPLDVPDPVTVAVGPGGSIWAGGETCTGTPVVCAAALWVSSDGGSEWRQAFSDPGPAAGTVSAVAPGPAGTGLLADGQGLWRLAGGQWQRQTFPGSTPVLLAMGATGTAAALDSSGRLWRSSDGGATWTAEAAPCAGGARAAGLHWSAAGPVEAVCVQHTLATVRRSDNGGATWSTTASSVLAAGLSAKGLSVAISGQSLAAADPGSVVDESHNGGASWQYVPGDHTPDATAPGLAWSANALLLIGAAGAGQALYGLESGPPLLGGLVPAPSAALATPSALDAWSAGAASDPGALLATTDGGRTWTLLHDFATAVTAASFTGGQRGWAVVRAAAGTPCPLQTGAQSGTCLWTTTDGGQQWTLAAGAPPDPRWVDTFAGGAAVVVTQAGAVYRTAGSGTGWTARGVVPSGTALATFGSPDFGAAVVPGNATNATLFLTQDGGRTWTGQALPAGTALSVSIPSPGTLWVSERVCTGSGCTGEVLVSTDGGSRWTENGVGAAVAGGAGGGAPAFTVTGVSGTSAWLLVPGRVAYHTTDGGRAWTEG